MRCYICDFNEEETPQTNNSTFYDRKTGKEICQVCYDVALQAGLEFEQDESARKDGN